MIRPATIIDARAIAQIHIRAWQAAYQNIVPDDFLENLSIEERTQSWEGALASTKTQTLLSEEDGSIHGWICFGPGRDAGCQRNLEILALYVDPAQWRTGVGQELVEFMERHFANQQPETYLWVLSDNAPAQRFYEAMGFANSGATKNITWGGVTLKELKYEKLNAPLPPEAA